MLQQIESSDPAWASRLRNNRVICKLNSFLASPWYVLMIGLMTVCANVFGMELPVYTAFILLGIYMSLFGRDYLPLMPIVICCYVAPSVMNNPGRNPDSIFYPQNGGIYLGVLLVLLILSICIRLVMDKQLGGKGFLKAERKLLPGILILGAAYLLAGAFGGRYFEKGINNLGFALVQFLSIFVPYWFFAGAVRWDKAKADYLSWVGVSVALAVSMEILGVYLINNVVVDQVIVTPQIYTGWGNANNIGCMIAMMIPFAVALANHPKWGWGFSALAVILVGAVCFTCSRTSMFAAGFMYVVSSVLFFKDPQRRKALIFSGIIGFILLLCLILFHKTVLQLFGELVARWIDPRGRVPIYTTGIRIFLEHPIFGDTFYPDQNVIYEWSTLADFKAILPARWHNTVIQLLASCGIVGLVCYGIHRVQTVKLFWRRRKTPVIYIGLSVLALLMMSMLDCHMFNVGPVLFYAMALAFAEKVKTE